MNKWLTPLAFLLLSSSVYAATIKCNVYTSPGPGCLVGIYNQTLYNTHAFLCSQGLNYYYYRCFIDVGNGVKIPINFTDNCNGNNIIIYLYNLTDSHVSLVPGPKYPICLDNKFSNILNIYNTYSTALVNIPTGAVPILGLYNYINSHIQGINGNYEVYLYISDKNPPNINVNLRNNSYVLVPTIFNITCSDDNFVYLCSYTLLESKVSQKKVCYSKSCGFKFTLTPSLCPKPICTIKIESVDLAGNVRTVIYRYHIINTKLQIVFHPNLEINSLYDLYSKTKYTVTIKNTGSTNLSNVCISRFGCEHLLMISNGVQDISIPLCVGNLLPGEEKNITLYFLPYKIGVCKLKIIANATDAVTHNPVEDVVTSYIEISEEIGPFHLRVVDEKLSGAVLLIVAGTLLLI